MTTVQGKVQTEESKASRPTSVLGNIKTYRDARQADDCSIARDSWTEYDKNLAGSQKHLQSWSTNSMTHQYSRVSLCKTQRHILLFHDRTAPQLPSHLRQSSYHHYHTTTTLVAMVMAVTMAIPVAMAMVATGSTCPHLVHTHSPRPHT